MVPHIATVLALLPAQRRARAEAFTRAAQQIAGDALASLVVYGSSVRGGLTPQSDVDILAVLTKDDHAILRALHDAAAVARAAGRVDLTVLVETELQRAADVFPVFYDDVRGCHAILCGRDVFSDLVVYDEHRRLRVEQELREAQIALRALVLEHAFDSASLRVGVNALIKRVRAPLSSLLRLHGSHAKDDLVTVLDLTGKRLDTDTVPLTNASESDEAMLHAATQLLQRAVFDVDTLSVSPHDHHR